MARGGDGAPAMPPCQRSPVVPHQYTTYNLSIHARDHSTHVIPRLLAPSSSGSTSRCSAWLDFKQFKSSA
eukprot:6202635-Pleurochrysis_carterae.AAC.3